MPIFSGDSHISCRCTVHVDEEEAELVEYHIKLPTGKVFVYRVCSGVYAGVLKFLEMLFW